MTEWPDPKEEWEFPFRRRTQFVVLRAFRRQLELERRYTEKLFNSLLLAINTEMGFAEQRMIAKFEEIDTSLSLIAHEIARRDDPPSDGTGS